MQIIVIGKSSCARKLADYLAINKENIVFSTVKCNYANYTDILPNNIREIKDFISANEISLLIAADMEYSNMEWGEILSDTECCVFSPDYFGAKLSSNLPFGKKFAYKSGLLTSKFSVFEKFQPFSDYIKTAKFPVVVSPETISDMETSYIAETREKARQKAELLFETGNKKVFTEEYIHGKEYTVYFLTDGTNRIFLSDTISYFDEVSTNYTNCVSKEAKDKIFNEYIPLFFNSFMEESSDYTGVLGLKFIIKRDEIYFSRFKTFISDIDLDIILKTLVNFSDILYKTACGEIFQNENEIEKNNEIVICADKDGEFITAQSKTMAGALRLMEFEGADISEALEHWRS